MKQDYAKNGLPHGSSVYVGSCGCIRAFAMFMKTVIETNSFIGVDWNQRELTIQ